MSKLEIWLQQVCHGVGVKVDFPFEVICPDGHEIRSIARIRGVGDTNGMLVMNSYQDVKGHLECLRSLGFGFTVLSEPQGDEIINLKSAREMFDEWGWVTNDLT